jgi:hypothetical protein
MKRQSIGVILAAAFAWALVLAVAPGIHERIHADATRADHGCVVTLLHSGSYHHFVPPACAPALHPMMFGPVCNAFAPRSRAALFLSARIFEHAPPALS